MLFKKIGRPTFTAEHVSEFPSTIVDHVAYIVGEANYRWLAVFRCPCGCKQIIQLNLLSDATPCWSFSVHKKKFISIWPSIWRTTGCKSHFTIRRGYINWVKDWDTRWNS